MNIKIPKRPLIEWGLLLSTFAILYVGGWHTEVIGKVQQGVLYTGLFNPSVENAEATSEKDTQVPPEADFSLELRNQEGELVKMEDLRGKVIFLNFWATWCPPCVAEMPGIDALSKKVNKEEVVFLMVSLDEDFKKAKAFQKRKGFSFDVHELTGTLPRMYYSQAIPTTYVISGDGKLVFSHKGMADYNTAEFQEFLLDQK